MFLGFVLLLFQAHAGGPEAWASLHDGLLNQSMDRDPFAAIDSYEALLSGIPEGDPMRGDLLYWLGRARLASGDSAGAMETLGAAKKVWSSRAKSRALLGRLMAQQKAVRRLPHKQDFETDTGPWVRGWNRGTDADLTIVGQPRSKAAEWQIEVRDDQEDFLTFALNTDGTPVRVISMQLQATKFPVVVEFHLMDADGRRWRAPMIQVPIGAWTSVDLPISRFIDQDQGVVAGTNKGDQLRWVRLREVTAMHLEDRGENTILIDNMSVK